MALKLPQKVNRQNMVDAINEKFVGLKDKSSITTCTFNVDKKIHSEFKAICALNGQSMSELVEEFMRDILKNN